MNTSKTMRSSELRGSKSVGNDGSNALSRAIFDRQSNTEEFLSTLTTGNSEIDTTKCDIEQLMVRAHPFCLHNGFASSGVHLAKTPPRCADKPTVFSRPVQRYFSAALARKITS
jgi:hypothetical protein